MPYETGTAIVGTVKTTVFDPRRINNWPKYFSIWNRGPAPFTSGVVEITCLPEATWGTADGTTFASTGSGVAAHSWFNDPRLYWRISAAVASGSIATVIWTCNY